MGEDSHHWIRHFKRNPYAQEHIIKFFSFLYENTNDSQIKPQKELHVCSHKNMNLLHKNILRITTTFYNQVLTLAVVEEFYKASSSSFMAYLVLSQSMYVVIVIQVVVILAMC